MNLKKELFVLLFFVIAIGFIAFPYYRNAIVLLFFKSTNTYGTIVCKKQESDGDGDYINYKIKLTVGDRIKYIKRGISLSFMDSQYDVGDKIQVFVSLKFPKIYVFVDILQFSEYFFVMIVYLIILYRLFEICKKYIKSIKNIYS